MQHSTPRQSEKARRHLLYHGYANDRKSKQSTVMHTENEEGSQGQPLNSLDSKGEEKKTE